MQTWVFMGSILCPRKTLGYLEIIMLELNYIMSLWLCPCSTEATMKRLLTVDIPGHTAVGQFLDFDELIWIVKSQDTSAMLASLTHMFHK